MNNEKNPLVSMIKGLAVGALVGTVATVVVTNGKSKLSKKIKNNTENAVESISSMFKMD